MVNVKAGSLQHQTMQEALEKKALQFELDEKSLQLRMVHQRGRQLKQALDEITAAATDMATKLGYDMDTGTDSGNGLTFGILFKQRNSFIEYELWPSPHEEKIFIQYVTFRTFKSTVASGILVLDANGKYDPTTTMRNNLLTKRELNSVLKTCNLVKAILAPTSVHFIKEMAHA